MLCLNDLSLLFFLKLYLSIIEGLQLTVLAFEGTLERSSSETTCGGRVLWLSQLLKGVTNI
jgi:hypothetical protein